MILDVFSRFPLAARLFAKEPSADEIAELVDVAASRHGKPKRVLSDQGPQFTAESFERTLRRLGARERWGAIGSSGSIAIIERFWKTLKSAASPRSLLPREVERRLELTLLHYAYPPPPPGARREDAGRGLFRIARASAHSRAAREARRNRTRPARHDRLPRSRRRAAPDPRPQSRLSPRSSSRGSLEGRRVASWAPSRTPEPLAAPAASPCPAISAVREPPNDRARSLPMPIAALHTNRDRVPVHRRRSSAPAVLPQT